MERYAPYLESLASQAQRMSDLVVEWVKIPTPSYDLVGLAHFNEKIKTAFAPLNATVEELDLAPQKVVDSAGKLGEKKLGKALRFRKRPVAKLQVFLGIHSDVVYGVESTVTPTLRLENGKLFASGATDAKGGLVIMLKALEAFEASPFAENVGWEVLINPDEELGSPGSKPYLVEAAGRNHLGLLFEPALSNGNLVGARKGSGNFAAVIQGKAAHAGRDPHLGRNAIHALGHLIVELELYGKNNPGININVGKIEGGGPLNRVPDLAIARFNLRVTDFAQQVRAEKFLSQLSLDYSSRYDIRLEITGGFSSPPKPLTPKNVVLLQLIQNCGKDLNLNLAWEESGGVSDGNKLAAAGLVNVDTLGAVGGNIHSPDEFLILKSLVERSQLTALFLMQLKPEMLIEKSN